jgi:dipeptidyl-peptidase-4
VEEKAIARTRATYKSKDGTDLVGYLYAPGGVLDERLPAVVWNHGSEPDPTPDRQFQHIAELLVPEGYVVMAPERRGQGESSGKYIVDATQEAKAAGKDAGKVMVHLMETTQLDDQLAGLAYLKSRSFVDPGRIAVMGCSYGGIQTLLGAESQAAGYQAAVALSPGAESWKGNEPLRTRLLAAVGATRIPVMIGHPQGDASVEPGYTLGARMQMLGRPYELVIFPKLGPPDSQGHCFGGMYNSYVFGEEVLHFLRVAMRTPAHPEVKHQ